MISNSVSQNRASFPAFNPSVHRRDNDVVSQQKQTGTRETEQKTTPDNQQEKNPASAAVNNKQQLSQQEQKQIDELQKRDSEVKAHEMAHVAAGGQYINGQVNYQYQTGPDGRRYAVGGDVSIDISEVPGDPDATVSKMQTIRQAALAPESPSQTDRMIASKALQLEAKARMDAMLNRINESNKDDEASPKTDEKSGSEKYSEQTNAPIEKGQVIDIAA